MNYYIQGTWLPIKSSCSLPLHPGNYTEMLRHSALWMPGVGRINFIESSRNFRREAKLRKLLRLAVCSDQFVPCLALVDIQYQDEKVLVELPSFLCLFASPGYRKTDLLSDIKATNLSLVQCFGPLAGQIRETNAPSPRASSNNSVPRITWHLWV